MSDKNKKNFKTISLTSSDLSFIKKCVLSVGFTASTELLKSKDSDVDSGAFECSVQAIRIVKKLEAVE